jgi:replicative DNA helicase
VDYLQLIRAPGYSDPKLRVSFVMKELVRISKELMIPVVVLAQVGRQAEGTMPTLSDLKESGSVEEDSDTVILLHREKRDSEELLCEVAKQRNGEIAKLTLAMRNGVVMAVSEVATEFHNDFGGY